MKDTTGMESLESVLALIILSVNFVLCSLISVWMFRAYQEIKNSPSAYPSLWLSINVFVTLSGFSSLAGLFHNPWYYLFIKFLLMLTLAWISIVVWVNRYDIQLRAKIIHELSKQREE